jgi:hypothetical protein
MIPEGAPKPKTIEGDELTELERCLLHDIKLTKNEKKLAKATGVDRRVIVDKLDSLSARGYLTERIELTEKGYDLRARVPYVHPVVDGAGVCSICLQDLCDICAVRTGGELYCQQCQPRILTPRLMIRELRHKFTTLGARALGVHSHYLPRRPEPLGTVETNSSEHIRPT